MESVFVLNFGGQYCHLIARRVRELGVSSEIVPFNISIKELRERKPVGLILSGGPNDVNAKNALLCGKKILELGVPVLGICYGHQLIARLLRGKVVSGETKEYGKAVLEIKKQSPLFKGMKKKQAVWLSHGDTVSSLPNGFEVVGSTKNCKRAAVQNLSIKIFGVQFHPEVQHTENGQRMLKNFVFNVCKAKRNYSLKGLGREIIREIREEVGKEKVLMGVSGGVDSLVAAVLLHKAIPRQLFCVFIDNGFLRKRDARHTTALFKGLGFRHFFFVDASKEFIRALKGVTAPEKKRKIVGFKFIEVFERKAMELEKRFGGISFLAQGTIYPDRIESAAPVKEAAKIKSHHNLMLPKKMKLKVIEPLKNLYKDEVRALGKQLGLKEEFLWRHPFPGPGLSVRVLGEVTEKKLQILREADSIFIKELKQANLYSKVWQAFAVLLDCKSVGVMGDFRTYEFILSIRAVTSSDAMTADWARLPHDFLERVSTRIINEVKGVNRVVYDISQKPPATIEYE